MLGYLCRPMTDLRIVATRGAVVESVHACSVAVTDVDGRLVAASGDPGRVTFWRSAAKPFQAMPLVDGGAADAFGIGDEELALACASHSSERAHLDVAERFLRRIGCDESQLGCGPHPPIDVAVAEQAIRAATPLTPKWSNCSGKHAGMLAASRHQGWPLEGYVDPAHPLQRRVRDVVAEWSGAAPDALAHAVDGCTAPTFALPLRAMATAWARFGASSAATPARLRGAMSRHALLVAGTGRLCTDLMNAAEGTIIAKVGAEGVYCAAVPAAGLGIALKIEDGDNRASPIALLAVLGAILPAALPAAVRLLAVPSVARHAEIATLNTRGAVVGARRADGTLRFHD